MTSPEAVKQIIDANGGSLIGKTRLQKTVYFLESLGVGYGFKFDYHYYGPYSESLSIAAGDAEALKLISSDREVSKSGMSYAVFRSVPEQSIDLPELGPKRRAILSKLQMYDATSLELAATADFLKKNGFAEDPWTETRRRKSLKATTERLEKAERLLSELEEVHKSL